LKKKGIESFITSFFVDVVQRQGGRERERPCSSYLYLACTEVLSLLPRGKFSGREKKRERGEKRKNDWS